VCLREMADADRTPLQNQLRLLVLQLDALPDRAERGNRALVATGVGPTGVGSAKRSPTAAVCRRRAVSISHAALRNLNKNNCIDPNSVKLLESVMLMKPIGQGLYL
jgi:hypothetical protein